MTIYSLLSLSPLDCEPLKRGNNTFIQHYVLSTQHVSGARDRVVMMFMALITSAMGSEPTPPQLCPHCPTQGQACCSRPAHV